jgi:hypothetical protein
MSKPEFRIYPCALCTVGYSTYVIAHRLVRGTYNWVASKSNKPATEQLGIEAPKQKTPIKDAFETSYDEPQWPR